MISKLTMELAREKMAVKLAGATGTLLGLGALGAAGAGISHVGQGLYRDHQFGRTKRLEAKAARMHAMMQAKQNPYGMGARYA